MVRTTAILLVALSAGWCGSTVGVAPALNQISQVRSARVLACPDKNAWLGLPYLNRYADGNCGYVINGTILPIPKRLLAFPAHAVTLYQEAPVVIDAGTTFTLAAGSTLIMRGDPRKMDTGYLDLAVHGRLVVQPGVTFRVAGGSIRVGPPGAALEMRGTPTRPIILTSAQPHPAPGDWGRIEFDPGASGTLAYVHLSYAGAPRLVTSNGTVSYHAGIAINGATVSVTHSTVDHGAGNGIEIDGSSEPVLSADRLLDNAGWAVQYLFVPRDLTRLAHLSARGRGINVVGITPGHYGTTSGTWHSPGLPLRIAFDTPQSGPGDVFLGTTGATLTVAPGTTIQMVRGASSIVVTAGGLVMRGTRRQPIILTSAQPHPAPGDWGRIEFDPGANGRLAYVHLSYAGATRLLNGNGSVTAHAAILIAGATASIADSTIDHSGGHDVEVTGGARPTLLLNRFLPIPPGNDGVINDAGTAGPPVDARNNYWGAASGPRDPARNPSGRGTPVSPGVLYRPWLPRWLPR